MTRFIIALAALLVSGVLPPDARAADGIPGNGPIVIAQIGTISDGHCRCKDECEVGQSVFSQGRTIAQCKSKCRQAFSGCTRGEVRSIQRRDRD